VFGNIGIAEGSGRVGLDENASGNCQRGAMELLLVAEVAGLSTANDRRVATCTQTCCTLFLKAVGSVLHVSWHAFCVMKNVHGGLCRQWETAWSCVVVFSDNAASFAAVKELTDRHAALAARRSSLQERLSMSNRAVQVRAGPQHQALLDLICSVQPDVLGANHAGIPQFWALVTQTWLFCNVSSNRRLGRSSRPAIRLWHRSGGP
jgi:hypothetical protein